MFNFQQQGLDFSEPEVWIMLETTNQAQTSAQLARKRGISRQGIYNHIKLLKDKKMLTWTTLGNEKYYRCPYDLTNPKATTISILIKSRRCTFEELIGYLNFNYLELIQRGVKQAICHVYFRLMKAADGESLPEPSPVDTKLFLKAMQDELLQYAALVHQLSELDVYDDHPRTLERLTELFKHENTLGIIEWWNSQFQRNWDNKVLTRKGMPTNDEWSVKNLSQHGLNNTPWPKNSSEERESQD